MGEEGPGVGGFSRNQNCTSDAMSSFPMSQAGAGRECLVCPGPLTSR